MAIVLCLIVSLKLPLTLGQGIVEGETDADPLSLEYCLDSLSRGLANGERDAATLDVYAPLSLPEGPDSVTLPLREGFGWVAASLKEGDVDRVGEKETVSSDVSLAVGDDGVAVTLKETVFDSVEPSLKE